MLKLARNALDKLEIFLDNKGQKQNGNLSLYYMKNKCNLV